MAADTPKRRTTPFPSTGWTRTEDDGDRTTPTMDLETYALQQARRSLRPPPEASEVRTEPRTHFHDDELEDSRVRPLSLIPVLGDELEEGSEVRLRTAAPAARAEDDLDTAASDPQHMADNMWRSFTSGDFAGALDLAELVLEAEPQHALAHDCAEACRGELEGSILASIGPLERVPWAAPDALTHLPLTLDHRAGFLLAQIDGQLTLESLLDVAGMPRLQALRLLQELMRLRLVT